MFIILLLLSPPFLIFKSYCKLVVCLVLVSFFGIHIQEFYCTLNTSNEGFSVQYSGLNHLLTHTCPVCIESAHDSTIC